MKVKELLQEILMKAPALDADVYFDYPDSDVEDTGKVLELSYITDADDADSLFFIFRDYHSKR